MEKRHTHRLELGSLLRGASPKRGFRCSRAGPPSAVGRVAAIERGTGHVIEDAAITLYRIDASEFSVFLLFVKVQGCLESVRHELADTWNHYLEDQSPEDQVENARR